MANIAQMVNVLQAVVLTREEEMILTPTYHVFDLYKEHQGAERVESYIQQDLTGPEEARVNALSVSASEDENGRLHATVVNLDAENSRNLTCLLEGGEYRRAKVSLISGDMYAHNDFGGKTEVTIRSLPELEVKENTFTVSLPACSVMRITIEA